MAVINVYSVNYTKFAEGGKKDNYIERGLVDTPIKVIYDKIVLGVADDTSTVLLHSPPKYATIVNITMWITGDHGASVVFDVGDNDTVDRYMADIGAEVVGQHDIFSSILAASNTMTVAKIAGLFYQTGQADGDEQLKLTVDGANTDAEHTIYMRIDYTS